MSNSNLTAFRHCCGSDYDMDDCLRPTDEAFKGVYERGYRSWYKSWADSVHDSPLSPLEARNLFPEHPILPDGLEEQAGLVEAHSVWVGTESDADGSKLQQTFRLSPAKVRRPTRIVLINNPDLAPFEEIGKRDSHFFVLTLAWAYALSARWVQIIAGTSLMEYSTSRARWVNEDIPNNKTGKGAVVVELGDVSCEAARWWEAVLALGYGWIATKKHSFSPWSVILDEDWVGILLSGNLQDTPIPQQPASFRSALQFIEDYSMLHDASRQSRAALAAALHLPVANLENDEILLHAPPGHCKPVPYGPISRIPQGQREVERLLALSMNARGMRRVLGSVLYEPGIPANICGAWMQGAMAVLKAKEVEGRDILARILFKRSPGISFLWLGAILTGGHRIFLRRGYCHKYIMTDIHEAAWTGTISSFIQEPVTPVSDDTKWITRANECRMKFLTGEIHDAPVYPYPPSGNTRVDRADPYVKPQEGYPGGHQLQYVFSQWYCAGGEVMTHTAVPPPFPTNANKRLDHGNRDGDTEIEVDYSLLDRVTDDSIWITAKMIQWMQIPYRPNSHEWLQTLYRKDPFYGLSLEHADLTHSSECVGSDSTGS